jgi:hypothetical protein
MDARTLRERLAALSPAQRDQVRRQLPKIVPASQLQFGMWLHEQLNPDSVLYLNPVVLWIKGPLDEAVLKEALTALAVRHAPLRACYREGDDGDLLAVVDPPHMVRVDFASMNTRTAEDPAGEAARLAERSIFVPFDLGVAPVWRARLVRYAPDEHLLALAFHHICSDGGTLAIVYSELTGNYRTLIAGRPNELPEPKTTYFALLADRERESYSDSLAYWAGQLADAPTEIPLWHLEDADSRDGGGVPVALDGDLSARISRVCARRGASGFAGILATFAVLLSLESGQRDIVLTTPVDTRGQEGAGLAGCFVNTVVLRIPVPPADTLEQVLANAAKTLIGALDHSGVPFARMLAETRPRSRNEPMPFDTVAIVHNNAPLGALVWEGLDVSHHPLWPRHVKHDFTLSVGRTPDGWVGRLEYSGRYSAERARSLLRRWTEIVQVFVDDPETRVADVLDSVGAHR